MGILVLAALVMALVATGLAIWKKIAWGQFWLCVGLAIAGFGWLVSSVLVCLAGAKLAWAQLLTLPVAFGIGFAVQDAAEADSSAPGKLRRRAAIERALMWAALLVLEIFVSGAVRSYLDKPQKTELTVATATYVRGVVRDQEFLEARVKLGQLQVGTPTSPGAVWQPARFISAQHPALTVADLHDLRAGYTLELAGTEVPKGTTGWLLLKSQLAPEAKEALKGVMARQAIGDGEKWPGHFVDPISGETLPLRFYQRGDGKWVRVVGAAIMSGPMGEKVIDLALRWDDKALFDDVSKHAIGLGGWLNPPYTGKKAPAKGGLGIF